MTRHKYHCAPSIASSPGSEDHAACESRVEFLAQGAAELVEYYEGIVHTLRRQRDAAHYELRVAKEHLAVLQVTP